MPLFNPFYGRCDQYASIYTNVFALMLILCMCIPFTTNHISVPHLTSVNQRQEKATPWDIKKRMFGPNDKNEKCLGSNFEMNEICENSYWRTPRIFCWFLSYLWGDYQRKLFWKKTVLIKMLGETFSKQELM